MLIFLKLGGSLITDKTSPYTPRLDKLDEQAVQIAAALREDANIQLVLGHGSGSFGHQAARNYGTHEGVSTPDEWRGFAEVWYQASRLNRLVVEALRKAQLPAITLAPVAMVSASDGEVATWDLTSIRAALSHSLLPVIHGDVIFDDKRSGTILSTETLFAALARQLHPKRILLAGLEEGVWKDFPNRSDLIKVITPSFPALHVTSLNLSAGADVTGGMKAKVTEMLRLVEEVADLEVLIYSGEKPDNTRHALQGENPGTLIRR